MTTLPRCLAVVAALWLAVAGARDAGREHGREPEERAIAERYRANYKALHELIAEATKLESAYLESNDLAAFRKAGRAWETRASGFLRGNLPSFYAAEFARAKYRGPDVPVDHDATARAAYQRIEARKAALQGYLNELRKPD